MTQDEAKNMSNEQAIQILKAMMSMVRNQHGLPYADIEPIRRGKWIWDEAYEMFTCSKCGKQMIRNDYPFCAFCGAKMEDTE